MINGVNGQFHSCSETWLTLYFELLKEYKISGSLFKILEQVIQRIVNNIIPQNSEIFWKITMNYLHENLQSCTEKNNIGYLNSILECIGQAVEYRSGYFLINPNCVIKELLQLISISNLPDEIMLSAVKIIVLLLLSKCIKLQQEEASSLTRNVLKVESKDVFLFFIEHTFEYPSFEPLILPSFLKYCIKHELDDACLSTLAKLVVAKSPFCESGIDIEKWHKYSLNFNSIANNDIIVQVLLQHLRINKENFCSNQENYIYSVLCLPHIVYGNETEQTLYENIETLSEMIRNGSNIRRNLFLLLITFECLTHVADRSKLITFKSTFMKTILPLCSNIKYISASKLFDMFLVVTKEESINMKNLMLIHNSLERNFNSPFHEVRHFL